MPRQAVPAIGDSVEVSLSPIPRRVNPDRHPEIAVSSQQEAKQQSSRARVQHAQPIFSGISEVAVAKYCRGENRGRPEPYCLAQRVQAIAAVMEFLLQRDNRESKSV